MASATAAAAASMTETAPDVDECASEIGATDDICVVEMLQPNDTVRNNKPHSSPCCTRSQRATRDACRRRGSVGGKCIWPATDWLRKLRNNQSQPQQLPQLLEQQQQELESHTRRSSVLLMVLLSGNEMEAKAVVVSEQKSLQKTPQRLSRSHADDLDEAIDALWL
ncbi:uncharacterized protein Dmoj_GI12148 [Drosophila mojavensis]|uniref:Uncharacterized protein n=1 Tax=Drosophila mojavensis TaxID=7230 RepID=B4KV16_DROMO|nr:uncharacterized protein Dmoj_GI12148 [Drosophila mojavensis]